jgi:hypothetical protein
VECETGDGVWAAFEAIRDGFDLKPGNGRLKNNMDPKINNMKSADAKPPDMLINVVLGTNDAIVYPMVAEIQVHLAAINKLKRENHILYKVRRAESASELRDSTAPPAPAPAATLSTAAPVPVGTATVRAPSSMEAALPLLDARLPLSTSAELPAILVEEVPEPAAVQKTAPPPVVAKKKKVPPPVAQKKGQPSLGLGLGLGQPSVTATRRATKTEMPAPTSSALAAEVAALKAQMEKQQLEAEEKAARMAEEYSGQLKLKTEQLQGAEELLFVALHTALWKSNSPTNDALDAGVLATTLKSSGLPTEALQGVLAAAKKLPVGGLERKDKTNKAEFLEACELAIQAGGVFSMAPSKKLDDPMGDLYFEI